MARAAAKPKKEISMEEALWKSADKLRGSVEPAEYKHVVLSLFFLKFASDKFEKQRKMISEKYGEKFVDNIAFYTKDNVFFLPEESRWSYIIEHAKQDDIALKIDTALYNIEKSNPALKGALPDNYYSRLHIDTAKLASLLDEINRMNTDDEENDIIGRVYEYFLSKFALAEGKGKGEFYTPKSIVNLIAEMIEPYDGVLYDPCCGSGTIPIEAALIGRNIAPGISREFAAEGWEAIPSRLWKEERKAAFEAIDNDVNLKIYGSDINPAAIKAARANAEEAGVDDCIKFSVADVSALRTKALSGVMVTNPPYGQRIGEQEAIDRIYGVYRKFFEENPTWSLFVVTSDKTIEQKAMGRPADRRRKLYNGRLEICYYQFHGEKV